MELNKIIGLKVVGIKGFCSCGKRENYILPEIILFDDKKTMIILETQDYESYHDIRYIIYA